MTAYESRPKPVTLGLELGVDQGKDIRRDPVYVSERFPPLADSHQRGRYAPVEPTNLVKGEAVEWVSVLLCPTMIGILQCTTEDGSGACFSC